VLAVRLVPTKGGHALAGADEASAGPDDGGADDDTADDAGPDAASGGRSGLAGRVASLVVRVARKVRRRARRSARAVRSRMFRATIEVATSLPRRGKPVILFTSDSRAALGGNLELIHDRMLERGVHKRYRIKTIFRPATTLHRPFRDRIRLPLLLGRADIIIIDDYQPAIYWVPVRRHRIVQVWHAVGAFKMVGYSRVGRPGAPTPFARTHKNYSLVTVSAATDIEVYAEAFGISEASVRATGVPRVDRFFDPEYALRARELALAAHPQIEGKRTILFAPTFRGNGVRSATYDMGHLDLAAVHALCVEKDAIFIIRLHPFVGERPVIPAGLTDRIIDGSQAGIDINDLLFSVDLLITDYSSVIYEYSTFGRPALFYAWDLEEYVASRDFYEPYETFVPGRIVRTCEELVDAIQREDYDVDRMAGFAARHFEHHDAGSTDRVLDAILGG
jgi:CDP-ribitol ribitolphosphotransferase